MSDVAQIIAEIEEGLRLDNAVLLDRFIASIPASDLRALLDEVKRQRQENWRLGTELTLATPHNIRALLKQRNDYADRAEAAEARLREAVEVIRQLRIHVPHNSISAERARAFLAKLETTDE